MHSESASRPFTCRPRSRLGTHAYVRRESRDVPCLAPLPPLPACRAPLSAPVARDGGESREACCVGGARALIWAVCTARAFVLDVLVVNFPATDLWLCSFASVFLVVVCDFVFFSPLSFVILFQSRACGVTLWWSLPPRRCVSECVSRLGAQPIRVTRLSVVEILE